MIEYYASGGEIRDAQLRRGLLDICLLALLRRGDSYGYQLVKDMSELIEIT